MQGMFAGYGIIVILCIFGDRVQCERESDCTLSVRRVNQFSETCCVATGILSNAGVLRYGEQVHTAQHGSCKTIKSVMIRTIYILILVYAKVAFKTAVIPVRILYAIPYCHGLRPERWLELFRSLRD